MIKLFCFVLIATSGLANCAVIEYGERVVGDQLLYTESQKSIPSQDITQHSLIFTWMGQNETFSLLQFENNGYDTWSSVSPSDTTTEYRRYFALTITNFYTRQLVITMRVYGLPNQYREIGTSVGRDLKNVELITTTSGVNPEK